MLATVTALPAGRTGAQTIAGLAVDDSSRVALAGSVVRLLDRNQRAVAETRADAAGAFTVIVPASAAYQFLVRRPEGGAFRRRTFALTSDSLVERALQVIGTTEDFAAAVRRSIGPMRFVPAERAGNALRRSSNSASRSATPTSRSMVTL